MGLLRRGGVLAGIGLFLVGGLAGGLTVSLFHPAPDTSPIDNAQRDTRVTTTVSQQPVRATFQVSGMISPPSTVDVLPNTFSEREVISGGVRQVGDAVAAGDLIGEVSGRPVFAFPSDVPLYRDLTPGVQGNDVLAVQKVLVARKLLVKTSGTWDGVTSVAVTNLFKKAGYVAPDMGGGRGLPFVNTATIPGDGLVAVQVGPVGRVLGDQEPLLVLQTTPGVITARVDLLQARGFPVGGRVMASVGGSAPVASTVLAMSDYREDSNGTPPGYDISVGIPDGFVTPNNQNLPVTVSESSEVPMGLAVPLSVIRQDGVASYVWVASAAEGYSDMRVAVSVEAQANGYAILADNPDLTVGTTVVVVGER
ncbi:MAG: hypothetical protein FWD80_03800 [Propionibacteriaceae bacterium]|nr:hypothetical protein [Propionibacteriaceae bacterium]